MAANRNMRSWIEKAGACLALALQVSAPAAYSQRVTYAGSLQFASGNYIFTGRTNSLYLFNGVVVSLEAVQISVDMPLIRQTTPWVSYAGAGMIPSGGSEDSVVAGHMHGNTTSLPKKSSFQEVGLGDPVFRGNVELVRDNPAAPSIHLLAGVKPPVADVDKGFGTGRWDVGGGVALSKRVGSNVIFGDLTYWILGDLPSLGLENPLFYNIAFGRTLSEGKLSLFGAFSGSTEIIDNVEPPAQISFGFNCHPSSGPSPSGRLAFGLTESSPDITVSFGWKLNLRQ